MLLFEPRTFWVTSIFLPGHSFSFHISDLSLCHIDGQPEYILHYSTHSGGQSRGDWKPSKSRKPPAAVLKNSDDFNFFAIDEKYQSKTKFKKLKTLKDKETKEKKISEHQLVTRKIIPDTSLVRFSRKSDGNVLAWPVLEMKTQMFLRHERPWSVVRDLDGKYFWRKTH